MDEDARDFLENEEIVEAVNRFLGMIDEDRFEYFDVFEYEGIVDYFLDEGKIKKAATAVAYGLQIHPSSVSLKVKKAQILLIEGQAEESLELAIFAERIENTNPDVYLVKGSALVMLDQIDQAIEAYEKAVEYNYDDNDELLYNIGVTLGQAGECEQALVFLQQAYEANPKNELVLYELGYYYDRIQEFTKSIRYYNEYLDIDPFNASVWYNLGITFNRIGEHDKAVEAYDFSIALQDDFEQAYFNKANALSNNNRYKDAIPCYEEYLSYDKDNDDAYCYLGECYLNLEQFQEALQNYRKAIRVNKNNSNAWYGAGLIQWMDGKLPEALANLKKALKLDDENPDFWLMYGKISHEMEKYDQAESAFEKATVLDPDNAESWIAFAELEYDRGKLASSIEILKNASSSIADDPNINYRLTAYLLENNDEQSATGYFERALEIDFSNYRVLFDYYPEALQNESIKRLIKKHESTKL
ncbi:tetratricopeptide repeat protein [Mangrovibacterium marinum]|uniref:Tetratricopeptide repeat protein n=1 Tax=Mangrovibacterium marinum TaxID=1639118 RepID=A0A2T5BZ55_9BACT|nr:tetratricopeptide repeat protein [Mangrovibacterium marinum]PTN07541.1 tetratricopeptide repeat protein [Mangrovibacterium marinum]